MNPEQKEIGMNQEIEERRIAWRRSFNVSTRLGTCLWLYAFIACFVDVVKSGRYQGSSLSELPLWLNNTSSWDNIGLWLAVVLPVAYLFHRARSSSQDTRALRSKTLLALFGVVCALFVVDAIMLMLLQAQGEVGLDARTLGIMVVLLGVSAYMLVTGGQNRALDAQAQGARKEQ